MSGFLSAGLFNAIPDSVVSLFDANDLDLADGDPVNTWPDSANGNDFTTTNPPTYRATAFNNNPTVDFNLGSGNTLETNINVPQPFTLFFVVDLINTLESRHFFNDSTDSIHLQMHNSDTTFEPGYGRSGNWGGNKMLITMTYDGSNSEVRKNSSVQVSGSNSTDLSKFNIEYDRSSIQISEIQVRNEVPSNLSAIESDLMAKWGI